MKNLIYVATLVLLTGACKKKEQPENPATGNIAGKVSQTDQYGGAPSELDKVTVSLDNDDVTAVTDKDGNYFLSGVKPGIYTIYFSRPGYGTYQVQQFNFPGNGTLFRNVEIVETPTFKFNSASVTYKEASGGPDGELHINIKLDPQPKDVNAVVVLSKTTEMNPYWGKNQQAKSFKIPANTSDFNGTLNLSTIFFSPNTDLYAKVYTSSGKSVLYADAITQTSVVFGYGESLPAIKVK